jgi:ankyrin repeat protein
VNAIDLLLHRGAQGIDRVCDKYTPLQWAMLNGHYHAFMCLLSHGATVSSTWLYLAVKGKNIQIISKILEMEDLDINAINNEGMTALEVAITQGSLPIFNLLVTRGANVAQINSNGDSILHLAALKRQMPIIQRILEMNILNINVVNEESGEAPLHVALHEVAERDNASSADVIAIFASYGANLDAVTCEDDIEEGEVFAGRRTPLYFAIEAGDVAAVHALLQRGVDCNALTSGGCTPLDFAMKIKNGAIIRALSQKGATLSVPPTVEKMAKALVGLFDAQKRCLDESVDSPSKRVKPS